MPLLRSCDARSVNFPSGVPAVTVYSIPAISIFVSVSELTSPPPPAKGSFKPFSTLPRMNGPGVFSDDERIKLSPDHLQVCVGSLEEWKLFNSNLDVLDDAFEYLVSKSAKGEKGQYFTPALGDRHVRKDAETHRNRKTVIDTACGSAGFTVHSMFHVWEENPRRLGPTPVEPFHRRAQATALPRLRVEQGLRAGLRRKECTCVALPEPHCGATAKPTSCT